MSNTSTMVLCREKDEHFPFAWMQQPEENADQLIARMQQALEGDTYRSSVEFEVIEVEVTRRSSVKRDVRMVAEVSVEGDA